MSEIHEAFMVVVVVSTFWGVGRKEEVVRAEAVALCITVCKNAALQHFVVAVVDTRGHDSWGEGQLLVFIEEVVHILVQDHAAHRLQYSTQGVSITYMSTEYQNKLEYE